MPAAHPDGSPIQPNEYPASLPAYLIHVKAELKADGQIVATGGDFTLGTPVLASAGLYNPATNAWNYTTLDLLAGEYQALALDGQGIPGTTLDALKNGIDAATASLAAKQYANLGRDDLSGQVLQQTALGYLALVDANTRLYQRVSGTIDVRLPSYARAVARIQPTTALGVVTRVSFPGVTLSVDHLDHLAVSKQNASLLSYNRQNNERASAYAHLILEALLTDGTHPGNAVSAVKALQLANALGNKTWLVTPANAATVTPQLQVDETTRAAIKTPPPPATPSSAPTVLLR